MSNSYATDLVAIDVGNSRVKLGWFPAVGECASKPNARQLPIAPRTLPQAAETRSVAHGGDFSCDASAKVETWLDHVGARAARVLVGSVHPRAASGLLDLLARKSSSPPRQITCDDLALEMRVEQPERVGVDRLLSAVAANCLRKPDQPAIVVGAGTATTVNLIAADGAFEGGAILPGIAMSAAALHAGTASLPLLADALPERPPAAVGKSTTDAMAAGLYWGAVGAIGELIDHLTIECNTKPQLLFTGGEAPRLVAHFPGARHVPCMVLLGIALAAEELS